MREISRKEIEKKIKAEYKAARDFCDGGIGRYYNMMLDVSDGDIWSDVFLNEGDRKIYHSDSIMRLKYIPGYVSETEEGYINDAIRKLEKVGWTIK